MQNQKKMVHHFVDTWKVKKVSIKGGEKLALGLHFFIFSFVAEIEREGRREELSSGSSSLLPLVLPWDANKNR